MRKCILCLLSVFVSLTVYTQGVEGDWISVDDNSKEKKSELKVYLEDGKLYAKVEKLLLKPQNTLCGECKGDLKDKPVVGMNVITGLTKSGDVWKGGKIMDPENGKFYKCLVELVEPNKLKVRGYIGLQALGRTQYWIRKQ